jgi:nicotinamidase-related amidase
MTTPPVPPGAALLLIDVQQGFDDPVWGSRNNPDAERAAAALLAAWRERGWPVVHVQHDAVEPGSPLTPGQPGHAHKPEVAPRPGEAVVHKSVNSAFIGTDLQERLTALQVPGLVVVGLTTDHCVSTSVRMAGNLGFDTWLVADACAAHDRVGADGERYAAQLVHEVALASLHDEFATVVESGAVLAALPDGSVRPR